MVHSTEQPAPTPDEIDAALQSFWRGSSRELDRLIETSDGQGPAIGSALSSVIELQWSSLIESYVIPGYSLIGEIGRGGMAIVFEAVQCSTGRNVALKLVPGYSVTRERQGRFLRHEVQTLSLLRHDGIATLFDAGETIDKCQYFAMELVAGKPLSRHFAAGPVADLADLRRRLELVLDVCNAVAYAHGRGVIHCDLKPSNVLVDERGCAKVLDFGLARLLDTDPTVSLSLGGSSLMGTLAYMSPEQATGRTADIDIRSDVYSIGVVLYELMTGRRPYDLKNAQVPHAIQSICETQPRPASETAPLLPGDIDTIVLTALAKEPARRYQSAAALGADIQRFLDRRPIEARPASIPYHLAKWCSRHRLPAGLIASLIVLIVAFGVTEFRQATKLAQQRDEARQHARRADQAGAFLRSIFGSLDPNLNGADVSVGNVLDDAAARLDTELSDNPEAQAELHSTFGRGYIALARFQDAEREFEKSAAIWRSLVGELDARYASALHMSGMAATRTSTLEVMRSRIMRAYEIRGLLFQGDHPDLAESLHGLGVIHQYVDFPAAEKYERQSFDMRRRLFGDHALVAESLDSLGRTMGDAGRLTEAEPMLMQALEMRRRLLGIDSTEVGRTLGLLADVHVQTGLKDEAVRELREQIRIFTKAFGKRGSVYLAHAMSDLAVALEELGEFAEADENHKRAVAMEARCSVDGAAELSQHNYAAFLRLLGRYDEAESLARIVSASWTADSNGQPHTGSAYAAHNLGSILLETGRTEEGAALLETADRVWIRLLGEETPKRSPTLLALAQHDEDRGDYRGAKSRLEKAIDLMKPSRGENHPEMSFARLRIGRIESRQGQTVEGRRTTREAFDQVLADKRAGSLLKLRAQLGLAEDLLSWGELDAASGRLEAFLAEDTRLRLDRHPMRGDALLGQAEIAAARGDSMEARRLLAEATELFTFRNCLTPSRRLRVETLASRVSPN